MLLWMLYAVFVSVLLGAAALAAERIALAWRAPTRWHWIVSLSASAVGPVIMALAWVHVPRIAHLFIPTVPLQFDSLTFVPSSAVSTSSWMDSGTRSQLELPGLNMWLAWMWGGASCILLVPISPTTRAR